MKRNVRITIVDTEKNTCDLIQRDDITEKEMQELWAKYMYGIRGASTGNLNYEDEPPVEYNCECGAIRGTSKIVCWLYWESE